MRHAWLALVVLAAAGPAAPADAPAPSARSRPDLVTVSRAMAAIDASVRRGDVADERKRWSEAAATASRDAPARFLAIYAQPSGEERWAAFKAMAKEFPGSALGHVGMALVYVDWNVLDQADRSVAAALAVEPDGWLALLVRGKVGERRERDAQAAADYRAVLAADPGNPEAHLGLARLARKAGDLPAARGEAEAALAADGAFAPALEVLGQLAVDAGQTEEAIELWSRAAQASPRDRNARAMLAGLLARSGNAAGARDQWRAAVEIAEDAEGLAALASAARAAEDPETERRALERLAVLDPATPAWTRIAEIRIASQDWDGAEKALRRVLAADPRDAGAHLGLARVDLARGETRHAVEELRAAGEAGKQELAAVEKRINLQRLARKDVHALQRSVAGLVDRTFRARLAEAPGLSGVLRLRVTVDAAGTATLVEVLEDVLHDGDVLASAYWNLADATYPQGKPGRYSFTFTFRR
jgi:tetratricopeptide (TPR) repeat protein